MNGRSGDCGVERQVGDHKSSESGEFGGRVKGEGASAGEVCRTGVAGAIAEFSGNSDCAGGGDFMGAGAHRKGRAQTARKSDEVCVGTDTCDEWLGFGIGTVPGVD